MQPLWSLRAARTPRTQALCRHFDSLPMRSLGRSTVWPFEPVSQTPPPNFTHALTPSPSPSHCNGPRAHPGDDALKFSSRLPPDSSPRAPLSRGVLKGRVFFFVKDPP